MISIAVWTLTIAVAAGTALGLWHLRVAEGAGPPPRLPGIAHGIVGSIGLVTLLFALRGPPRGVAAGVGSFGMVAAVLFAAALLTGVAFLMLRRGSIVIAIHAGIAIIGYALLLAWSSLG